MTLSSSPNQDSRRAPAQIGISKLQPENRAEIIRASTPILIAAIGGLIGIFVLFTHPENNAGFGLASTAIAGAAGLAQPHKDPDQKDK